jgi:heme-degrading monooxygenase HmoA
MYMNVFRSRKRADYDAAAYADAARMGELAQAQPGFVDYKSFAAPDGETVTISVWESVEAARAWGRHPEHREAQARGRDQYYEQFTMYACDDARMRVFP